MCFFFSRLEFVGNRKPWSSASCLQCRQFLWTRTNIGRPFVGHNCSQVHSLGQPGSHAQLWRGQVTAFSNCSSGELVFSLIQLFTKISCLIIFIVSTSVFMIFSGSRFSFCFKSSPRQPDNLVRHGHWRITGKFVATACQDRNIRFVRVNTIARNEKETFVSDFLSWIGWNWPSILF